MTDAELEQVNRERAKRGLPPLNREQVAVAVVESRRGTIDDPGFDMMGFLIGYTTGIPIGPRGITLEALIGMAGHPEPSHATPAPDYTPDPSPSSDSSSSSDSGSSSSYDSGSSSSDSGSSGGSSE